MPRGPRPGNNRVAREAIEARPLGEVTVQDKTRPVVVYELLGLRPSPASS